MNRTLSQDSKAIGTRVRQRLSHPAAGNAEPGNTSEVSGGSALRSLTASGRVGEDSSGPESGNWSRSRQKRVFDVGVALCALLLLLPVMILTAIAVRLSSKGPALFRQDRMGKGGQTFTIYKFRTMRLCTRGSGPLVTKAGDARMTRIGRILRSTKLDELPQLINVVRGEMSLVGPRPKVPHHQTYELQVLPGITGAASLAFRNEQAVVEAIPEDRLDEYQLKVMMPVKKALDDEYARTATFYRDLVLLARTVFGSAELVDIEGIHRFGRSLVSLGRTIENIGHSSHTAQQVPVEFRFNLAFEYDADGRQNRKQAV